MAIEALNNITDGEDLIIKGAKGIQDGLYNIKDGKLFEYKAKGGTVRTYPILPSAEAVQIHNDGTLEVKVPNAQKVGRVLVMDTDSHIGGGLFYPDEAVQGEWIQTVAGNGWNEWGVLKCPFCGATIEDKQYRSWEYNFCPNCRAKLEGGGSE